jgi:hypothetical protein
VDVMAVVISSGGVKDVRKEALSDVASSLAAPGPIRASALYTCGLLLAHNRRMLSRKSRHIVLASPLVQEVFSSC